MQNWVSKWNTLGKLHKIQYGNCKNIQEFMTKICDVKSEIEDLEITMDKAITIQVLNLLNSSFTQFFSILSHNIREKAKLPTLESLAKFLKNKKLRLKNQDKATTNYAKQFTKKKTKLPLNQSENLQDPETDLVTKCKFCEKKYKPNKY